ncbi:MAG: hypothetical protein AB7L90_07890 [Hyphomicrobiaceae bacterium]
MVDDDRAKLRTRLAALGQRIEAHRHHSAATSGVPYGASRWSDILAQHAALVRHIADDRAHDASSFERLHADVEALSLSLDGWIEGIDRSFAASRPDSGERSD